MRLTKLSDDYDPTDRRMAVNAVMDHKAEGKLLTGLIYIDPDAENFSEMLNVSDKPLNQHREDTLCPGNPALQEINKGFS